MLIQSNHSERQSEIQKTLESLVAESERLHHDHTQQYQSLESLITGVQDTISRLRYEPPLQLPSINETLEAPQTVDLIEDVEPAPSSGTFSELSNSLSMLSLKVKSMTSDQMLLRSLWFESMEDRQDNVQTAHKNTFEWTYEKASPTNFEDWLHNRNGIYWIMGKAGSGKSTLMKFWLKHPQIAAALKSWAHPKKLVITSYFFWNAGTVMQKSQKGLLQSLLFGVLCQCPELIQSVCEAKVKAYQPFEGQVQAWTQEELWHALRQLSLQAGGNARFCFFIDGLDEYDGPLEHMVEVLQSLGKWSDIKLCISSRPDNAFTDAFEAEAGSCSALQDLTRNDIKKYVRDTFEGNPYFREMQAEDDRSQRLVTEIVDKASGVFLWVVLVVRSLLKGLNNRDTIEKLCESLHEFPESLEAFFARMINQIENVYRCQTAKAFKIALEVDLPLPWMVYSILIEEGAGTLGFESIKTLTYPDLASRQERMRRQLLSHCAGLLEVVGSSRIRQDYIDFSNGTYLQSVYRPRMDFLHLTAHDFLLTKDMQDQLSKDLPIGFEPNMCLCYIYFVQLKALDVSALGSSNKLPLKLLNDLMYYAHQIEIKSGATPEGFLDAVATFVSEQPSIFGRTRSNLDFLELLVRKELRLYLKIKLASKPPPTVFERNHLLETALQMKVHEYGHGSRDLGMIELLLDGGASLNSKYEGSTVWVKFLYSLCIQTTSENEETLLNILQCLLSHGAKLQQRLAFDHLIRPHRASFGSTASLHKRRSITGVKYDTAQELLTLMFGEVKMRILLNQGHGRRRSYVSNFMHLIFD